MVDIEVDERAVRDVDLRTLDVDGRGRSGRRRRAELRDAGEEQGCEDGGPDAAAQQYFFFAAVFQPS
jgi:hypothetical protein